MPTFTLSPGVLTREIDNTTSEQASGELLFGFSGKFEWGPVGHTTTVRDYNDLVANFGNPTDVSAVDHLLAQSYLSYGPLVVVRQGNAAEMANATVSGSGEVVVFDDEDFESDGNLTGEFWIAKYPGEAGNSIAVDTCVTPDQYETTLPGTFEFTRGSKRVTYVAMGDEVLTDYFDIGDFLTVNGVRNTIDSIDDDNDLVTLVRAYAGPKKPHNVTRLWRFAYIFADAPNENHIHVIVTDEGGDFTGEDGAILETYSNLSLSEKAKSDDGTSNYYRTAINRQSRYIRAGGGDVRTINAGDFVEHIVLAGGVSGNANFGLDESIDAYSEFLADDLSLLGIITGASDSTVSSFAIENIAEVRKDLIVTAGPPMQSVVNNRGRETEAVIAWRRTMPYSSYAVYDCNWKKMYDRHNDTYRWVPTNADVAGCIARAIREKGVGHSPAGEESGRIRNVDKLAWSPDKTARDRLYPNDINPVANFRGKGQLLYGDKTAYGQNSAFSQIGVRMLFIDAEISISRDAASLLFKFNDDVTRAYFVSRVDPKLRRRKGERVIRAYQIIADETVNTEDVVNSEEFRGVIRIVPSRSINGVQLDFVAENGIATFTETTITAE